MNYSEYVRSKNEILEIKKLVKNFIDKKDDIKNLFDLVVIHNDGSSFRQTQTDFFTGINDKFTDLTPIIDSKAPEKLLNKVFFNPEEDFCLYNKRFLLKKIEDKVITIIDGNYIEYDIGNDNIYIIKKGTGKESEFFDIQKDYLIVKNSMYYLDDKQINEVILPNTKNAVIEVNIGDTINIKREMNKEGLVVTIKNSIINPVVYKDGQLINPDCGTYLSSLAQRHKISNLVSSFKDIENKKYDTYDRLYNDLDDIYQLLIIMNDKTGRKELIPPAKIKDIIEKQFAFFKENYPFVLDKNDFKDKIVAMSVLSDMRFVGSDFTNTHNPRGIVSNKNIIELCLMSKNIAELESTKKVKKENEYKL